MDKLPFRQIWLVDFEFRAPAGERQIPVCMVAREYRTGHTLRLWADELARHPSPPFSIGPDSLFVAYYASAELGCFLSLRWPMPVRILDLFAEFRCISNGLGTPCGAGLLGALAYFGIDGIDSAEKEGMRQLAMRGGEHTTCEQVALLDYCESDVNALAALLPAMLPRIDLPRALLRGRFMPAAARIEFNGVPIDTSMHQDLRDHWGAIKTRLITEIDRDFGVFLPTGTTNSAPLQFSVARFEGWLTHNNIPWPRLESGQLALDDDTFRQMAKAYPAIAPLRELRHTLGEMRLFDLAVGSDGRNRCMLSAFRSITGRNQPSNATFIFGSSCWLRSLIQPPPGRAIANIDWSQQEFGIAAALSGDTAMQQAYLSGDPYLTFAKQAGAVPSHATKESHKAKRELFKVCSLAVQYGMGSKSLALKIDKPEALARELLRLHRQSYPAFWRWSEGAVDHGMLKGWLQTVFGWRVHVGPRANPRSLGNFPCQANGAEMLRLACCLATERGIAVCAPIHDALLIEANDHLITAAVEITQECMAAASRLVLDGFELRSDAKIVRHPDRYMDPRGQRMWGAVQGILSDLQRRPKPRTPDDVYGLPRTNRYGYPGRIVRPVPF